MPTSNGSITAEGNIISDGGWTLDAPGSSIIWGNVSGIVTYWFQVWSLHIPVPAGATINSAVLRLRPGSASPEVEDGGMIQIEDDATPTPPTGADILSKTWLANVVVDIYPAQEPDDYVEFDITTLVQALVDEQGEIEDLQLAGFPADEFTEFADTTFENWDAGTNKPELFITWTGPGSGLPSPQPSIGAGGPVFNSPVFTSPVIQ